MKKYLVMFFNNNALDSDSASMIWDGENSVMLANELEKAMFCDFSTTPHIGKIIDCMITLKNTVDKEERPKKLSVEGTHLWVYMCHAVTNKILDNYCEWYR